MDPPGLRLKLRAKLEESREGATTESKLAPTG